MRNFIIALVFFLAVIILITRITEVQAIGETLRKGDWRFIALALACRAAWIVTLASS
jgi:hypothetical protein